MQIVLKPRQDKHLLKGYPWVFANQIDRIQEVPQRGDIVHVCDTAGTVIGQGFYHDTSQIAVRILTFDPTITIDDDFFRNRILAAHELRSTFYADSTHYRLLFSESDGLPGTVVDRYGDVLTWTSLCYGMELRRDTLLDILDSIYHPSAMIERNDVWLRDKDGLSSQKSILRGDYSEDVLIEENGVQFAVDVINGPKTGFFIDQRHHRSVFSSFAKDKRVLDVCCADGGFGLQAAYHGAASIHFVDSSDNALQRVRANAERNNIQTALLFDEADALERLGQLSQSDQKYDLIVLDPPAFAKSRRHIETGTRAYQRLNISALNLLSENGILATSSCSQAIRETDFLKILRYSSRKAGVRLRTLYRGFQPPDHPVLDSMPETHYLKFYVFQKCWN